MCRHLLKDEINAKYVRYVNTHTHTHTHKIHAKYVRNTHKYTHFRWVSSTRNWRLCSHYVLAKVAMYTHRRTHANTYTKHVQNTHNTIQTHKTTLCVCIGTCVQRCWAKHGGAQRHCVRACTQTPRNTSGTHTHTQTYTHMFVCFSHTYEHTKGTQTYINTYVFCIECWCGYAWTSRNTTIVG